MEALVGIHLASRVNFLAELDSGLGLSQRPLLNVPCCSDHQGQAQRPERGRDKSASAVLQPLYVCVRLVHRLLAAPFMPSAAWIVILHLPHLGLY